MAATRCRRLTIPTTNWLRSGSSDVGRTDEMSVTEIKHCLTKMDATQPPLLDAGIDQPEVERGFKFVNMDREAGNDTESLTRAQFVEFLVWWAEYKFGKNAGCASISTAVARLLDEYMVPGAKALRSGVIRDTLLSQVRTGWHLAGFCVGKGTFQCSHPLSAHVKPGNATLS